MLTLKLISESWCELNFVERSLFSMEKSSNKVIINNNCKRDREREFYSMKLEKQIFISKELIKFELPFNITFNTN